MNRKIIFALSLFFLLPFILFALPMAEAISRGKEIPNLASAVKTANPGDYILLPSGKRYVLTTQEIEIAKGTFNYDNLSGVKTEIRADKTQIITISESHIVYKYPDGQSSHLFKTVPSYEAFIKYIESKYYLAEYVDYMGRISEHRNIGSPSFNIFRATAQFQNISNGIDEVEGVTVTVYNQKNKNFMKLYIAQPKFQWGNVSGNYKPVGESKK